VSSIAGGSGALLNRSIFYSTVSVIITTLLIIVTVASAMLRMAHEYGVAILLIIVAPVFFILSLVNLAGETRIALYDFDHAMAVVVM
jgi:hypothetical protein